MLETICFVKICAKRMNLHTSRILKNYFQVIEPMQKYKKTLHFKMCTLPTYLRIQFENQFLKIYIVELQDRPFLCI